MFYSPSVFQSSIINYTSGMSTENEQEEFGISHLQLWIPHITLAHIALEGHCEIDR
jgi:hypothetical protein